MSCNDDPTRIYFATLLGAFTERDTGQYDNGPCVNQFDNAIPRATESPENTPGTTPSTPIPNNGGDSGGGIVLELFLLIGLILRR